MEIICQGNISSIVKKDLPGLMICKIKLKPNHVSCAEILMEHSVWLIVEFGNSNEDGLSQFETAAMVLV